METALGCDDTHLETVSDKVALHAEVIQPWSKLVNVAKENGFELALASGYRGFERQRIIWNTKLSGARPVMDDHGCPISLDSLSPLERIHKVMRWSALPGTSRHHWGTDMDIYDRAAVSDTYQLQLVPDEYLGDGPFAPMMQWLSAYLEQEAAPAFFFPYQQDRQGLAPEPWHLSYRPVAERFQHLWSLSALSSLITNSDIAEKECIIENLDSLYQRYILPSLRPEYQSE